MTDAALFPLSPTMYISHRQSHQRCNTANVFMSPLMQSVGLSPVCYELWTLRKFPNTNIHVLLHIKHQGKNTISWSNGGEWFQKLLGNKANFLSKKLSLSVLLGAYNYPQYNFIFLSLFVANYISNHSHVALAHVFVNERVYTCVLA